MTTKTYLLIKQAKSSGGDRYENHDDDCPCNVIYVNQEYSRDKGVPKNTIEVTFDA